MESGWIINFKDGYSVILSEEKYQRIISKIENVRSVEHWFDIKEAIKCNPRLSIMYT